jgi:hypothetical protein
VLFTSDDHLAMPVSHLQSHCPINFSNAALSGSINSRASPTIRPSVFSNANMISNAFLPDLEPLLEVETISRPSSSHSCVSYDLQALPSYRKSWSRSSRSTLKTPRKPLHHHKTSYEDLPIFENPCPLCFFEYCHKVLKIWLRQ